jgi:hypothetical protein
MRAALIDAGLKTVGEVRAARSYELRQLPLIWDRIRLPISG